MCCSEHCTALYPLLWPHHCTALPSTPPCPQCCPHHCTALTIPVPSLWHCPHHCPALTTAPHCPHQCTAHTNVLSTAAPSPPHCSEQCAALTHCTVVCHVETYSRQLPVGFFTDTKEASHLKEYNQVATVWCSVHAVVLPRCCAVQSRWNHNAVSRHQRSLCAQK